MHDDTIGFICALVLAALVVVWIAYCMFCRERHKPESQQWDIGDLRLRNYRLAQELAESDAVKTKYIQDNELEIKKNLKDSTAESSTAAGKKTGVYVCILPSRHKKKDESYDKRPDYPESPTPVMLPPADRMLDLLEDRSPNANSSYEDSTLKIDDYNERYHSDMHTLV